MPIAPTDKGWDLPLPFVRNRRVDEAEIDDFGHANNAAYLRWADETAWAHWEADGLTRQGCRDADRGMAVIRTLADYSGHCRAGDILTCAVWIALSDGRLRAERWYQFRKRDTGETVFRARTWLVSFQLSTGKPARMTRDFARHYHVPDADLSEAVRAAHLRSALWALDE
ncbi:MAG TPA: acyl-CoA thioesterase [Oceanicaulis sp.]|jgi:acyl-CoA thioester hydrolase|uniref:Acyl-CoA thioesterase n=1 Tax=Glycocaulis albus TaxID=1382801 RepID=A0ABQ1XMC4_9PROT|nr:acyl-CoA thioesterase [Glycocaulis albus]MBV5259892.1 acyl-CoA thioesterase [Synechococcus moorigangaii CMS01]GGG97573.1 hypothetical protein GCM10007420_11640 [Glycocaulis albus]HCY54447.1 acyl-CoA thioesterase [Oceanicaulis sp.]